MDKPPFWHFWNPRTEMVGGIIAGAVVVVVLGVILAALLP